MAAPCYAVRRLAPFRGTLQVIQEDEGRAFSANGLTWKLELLSREPVRLPPWGELGTASAERRYFTYGLWSARGGLERVPLNAVLGDQSDHPAIGPLLKALEQAPGLPFPLTDRLELWLLDAADALPLALLRSQTPATDPPPVPRMQLSWRAMTRELPGGPAMARAGDDLSAGDVRALEQQVMSAAGDLGRCAQWFLRTSAGGNGLAVLGALTALEGRMLPAAAFPPLLVREDWPDRALRERMDAYVRRLAPALLTLPLSAGTRRRLERLAARHPRRLYGYHRLLPAIMEKEVVNAALVAARLEMAADG